MMSRAFCTIITKSHFAYAQALHESIVKFSPASLLYVLITDLDGPLEPLGDQPNLIVFGPNAVTLAGVGELLKKKYGNSEPDAYRWSMKPVFIKYLLVEKDMDHVIYLDCDIRFYSGFEFLFQYLEEYSFLLTPHWRSIDPMTDEQRFLVLLTEGIYNGGFIGAGKRSLAILDWWARVCLYECSKHPDKGLYDDQAYLNLIPVYFHNVKVIEHKGCNVAPWNMDVCKRNAQEDGTVLINGIDPIVFIHFSGPPSIYNSDDRLLKPYFMEYASSIRKFNPEIDLIAKLDSRKANTGNNLPKRMFNRIAKLKKYLLKSIDDKTEGTSE